MPTVFRSPPLVLQFFGNNGLPLVGGTLQLQVGGVNTPGYQDAAGTTPLPNPIPLNSRGEVSNAAGISQELWLLAATTYTATLFDASGNQINQYLNFAGTADAATTVTLAGNNTFSGTNTFNGTVQVKDANFLIVDDVDPTKQIKIQAAGIPTATVATLNVAAANVVEGVFGSAIASAATVNLDTATGDYESVTGTVTTTAITLTQGRERTVVAAAAWPITWSASLIGPAGVTSGTNTCVAGDVLKFRGEGSGVVRCVSYLGQGAPGKMGSMILLATKTAATSAALSFGTSDFDWTLYDEYEFHIVDLLPATNAVSLQFQVSENGGSTFISSAIYANTLLSFNGTTSSVATNSSVTANTITPTSQTNVSATGRLDAVVKFYRPSATGVNRQFSARDIVFVSAGGTLSGGFMIGDYVSTTNPINGVQFAYTSGNIVSGVIYAHGIKKV